MSVLSFFVIHSPGSEDCNTRGWPPAATWLWLWKKQPYPWGRREWEGALDPSRTHLKSSIWVCKLQCMWTWVHVGAKGKVASEMFLTSGAMPGCGMCQCTSTATALHGVSASQYALTAHLAKSTRFVAKTCHSKATWRASPGSPDSTAAAGWRPIQPPSTQNQRGCQNPGS